MDTKEQYRLYLLSDHWLRLRLAALDRDRRRCRKCGSRHLLQVHHIFYRARWVDTVLEDLMTLCDYHHRKAHRLPDKPKPVVPAHVSVGLVYGLNGWTKKKMLALPCKPVAVPKPHPAGPTKKRDKTQWRKHVKKQKSARRIQGAKARKSRHKWLNKKKKLGWSF